MGLAPTWRLVISPVFCPVFQVSLIPFGRPELPRLLCGDKWNELISICKQVWWRDTGGTHSLGINTNLAPQNWAKLLLEHHTQKHLFLNPFSCVVDVPRVTRPSENHRPAQRTPKSSCGFMRFFHSSKFMSTYCIPVPILGTEHRVMSKTKKTSAVPLYVRLNERQTSACVCLSTQTSTYICMYMCIPLSTYIYIHIYTYMFIGSQVYNCMHLFIHTYRKYGSPWDSDSEESACNAGDTGLIPGLGRSPGERNSNPVRYSCPENSMDRRAWQAIQSLGSQRVRQDRPINTSAFM